MNYRAHYDALVARAKWRSLSCYKERHHVIPRCLGGSDGAENLVDLTAEEHFVAHELLVKIYPNHPKLIFALNRMALRCNNNKVYGWIKKKLSVAARAQKGYWLNKDMPISVREKMSISRTGKKHSAETIKKMSQSAKGNKRALGTKHKKTEEHKKKLSEIRKGKALSEETKKKISESMKSHMADVKAGLASPGNRWTHGKRRKPAIATCERIAR